MLLRSVQNICWLLALPALIGMGLFVRVLSLHREREIQLHDNMRRAAELRREYEADGGFVGDNAY
jgi:hypothetical protein